MHAFSRAELSFNEFVVSFLINLHSSLIQIVSRVSVLPPLIVKCLDKLSFFSHFLYPLFYHVHKKEIACMRRSHFLVLVRLLFLLWAAVASSHDLFATVLLRPEWQKHSSFDQDSDRALVVWLVPGSDDIGDIGSVTEGLCDGGFTLLSLPCNHQQRRRLCRSSS